MLETPQAVWFTGGTPAQVKRQVRVTMNHARAKGAVGLAGFPAARTSQS
jgi:hypothetical protein